MRLHWHFTIAVQYKYLFLSQKDVPYSVDACVCIVHYSSNMDKVISGIEANSNTDQTTTR